MNISDLDACNVMEQNPVGLRYRDVDLPEGDGGAGRQDRDNQQDDNDCRKSIAAANHRLLGFRLCGYLSVHGIHIELLK
ncbi:hypothetical protein D3C73_1340710 [compost metagenome]